jgi:UDP-N-acetylglucosamine 2-epimerase
MICVSGQHRELLDPFLEFFDICPDYNFALMKPDQDLYHVTMNVLSGMREIVRAAHPEAVMVQGDTTTTLAATLAAFYEKIPVAHVEAGLRTGDPYKPFPEEMNRRLTDHMADWLFAPTVWAQQNLLAEGILKERIYVTGNTVVDALQMILKERRFRDLELPVSVPADHRLILVTAHRRESFGEQLEAICCALKEVAASSDDVEIVYPVHLSPRVRETVHRILEGVERVHLLEPLEYLPFLKLMERAYLILTDSGGLQEEAPTFGKPLLVLREETERLEGIETGVAKLVGLNTQRIVHETLTLLEDRAAYEKMAIAHNPYGDGRAAERIVRVLREQVKIPWR